jgi:hypothetical protein
MKISRVVFVISMILPGIASPFTQAETPSEKRNAAVEHRLNGCIRAENGKYLLQEKSAKKDLAGSQDFGSYIGRSVTLRGAFAPAANSSTPVGATGVPSRPQFVVEKIDVVSKTCNLDKEKTEQATNGKPSPYHK